MSFFRRLFSNTSEDEVSEDLSNKAETPQNNKQENPEEVTKPVTDPLKTGELTLPETEELSSETLNDGVLDELDNTLPILDELDEETLPNRTPDLSNAGDTVEKAEQGPGITRPLPEAEQFSDTNKGHLAFGQASDQGMVRLNNQDAAFSFYFTSETVDEFPDFGIFVVADGMGGHQEGEKASAITARTMATEVLSKIYIPLVNGVDINGPDQPTIVEAMVDAVQKANETVRKEVEDGGTTLTGVVVRGEAAHIAHVGDSRAYWINNGNSIERITRDHSVVERLIELGQITPEEAEYHDQRNVLYRAIGQNEDVEVEIHRKRLIPNSHILLCSDGLWNMVSDKDILEIIKNTPDTQTACEKLVALANAHGGSDNITAILIKTPTN